MKSGTNEKSTQYCETHDDPTPTRGQFGMIANGMVCARFGWYIIMHKNNGTTTKRALLSTEHLGLAIGWIGESSRRDRPCTQNNTDAKQPNQSNTFLKVNVWWQMAFVVLVLCALSAERIECIFEWFGNDRFMTYESCGMCVGLYGWVYNS